MFIQPDFRNIEGKNMAIHHLSNCLAQTAAYLSILQELLLVIEESMLLL